MAQADPSGVDLQWTSTITYAHNKNLVESLTIPDFQSAGGYPNRIRTGEPAGVFYGSYAARDCVTGALLTDSLGRYRRSNQAADMGNATQRVAISGGTCNDSLNAVIGDPNPKWMGALLNEPQILLADEPTGNLDPEVSNGIMKIFQQINKSGTAILMATHSYGLIKRFPTRILKCEEGKVLDSSVEKFELTNDY